MKRLINSVLLVLFVLGVVVGPALHQAACSQALCADECDITSGSQGRTICSVSVSPESDEGEGHFRNDGNADNPASRPHDAGHCTICRMAWTPVAIDAPSIFSSPNSLIASERLMPAKALLLRPAHTHPFSCGPPA